MVIKFNNSIRLTVLIGVVSFFNLNLFAQQSLNLVFNQDKDSETFGYLVIRGLDQHILEALKKKNLSSEDWKGIFLVQTGTEYRNEFPFMAGSYLIENSEIIFKPRFAFSIGVDYFASFNLPMMYSVIEMTSYGYDNQKIISKTFRIPDQKPQKLNQVVAVYPTSNSLPMNQLKLYIYFSGPMRFGQAYENIILLDSKGKEVENPFLEIREELWDAERTRFTIWFDPGRIKRDLAPNLQMGLPLVEGNSYKLIISKNWKDSFGNSLTEDYIKDFKVNSVDRISPDPDKWKIQTPALGSHDPLTIKFNEPMDFPLLNRMLWIEDSMGQMIEGDVEVLNNEEKWQFTPEKPWDNPFYHLVIDTDLEDLAGNNLQRLFDTDITKDKINSDLKRKITIQLDQN